MRNLHSWSIVLGLFLLGASSTLTAGPGDVKATAVVDQMMQAMGGEDAWAKMRYLRFDWVVEKDGKQVIAARHLWDRYDGRYRVEWETKDGKKMVALFNINTRAGQVYANGKPVSGEEEKKYLDAAFGRFTNDSYWLLMPCKLKDPGVNVEYKGETKLNGQAYDLLHVSFGEVGLTPGDQYWAYINKETHLMDRWAYFLQDYKGTPSLEKATPWEWKNWGSVGGMKLASEKDKVGENMRIYFPVLAALTQVDDKVFTSLEMPLPGPAPAQN